MKLETFNFKNNKWSVKSFPAMDSANTLVVVFGASKFLSDNKPVTELVNFYKNSKIVGCSSSGEIFDRNVDDDTLSVSVCKFDNTQVQVTSVPAKSLENSANAGAEIAKTLAKTKGLRAILVLSDGLKVNGSELIKAMNKNLDKGVVVTGGLAGDGARFKETWTIHNGKPTEGFISAVGFYGDKFKIAHGSKGGWDIFGPERIVTKSKGSILYELDNQPALDLYKSYLGDRANGLPATGLLFPLALRANEKDQKRLVRTILAVDEKTKSMTFAGDITQGFLCQLMRANFDHLVDGAGGAGEMIGKNFSNNPTLAIAISCVGRRLVLGERTEEEVEATMGVLPKQTRQIGFYSYGEISPYVQGESCDLHNQTMTLTAISED